MDIFNKIETKLKSLKLKIANNEHSKKLMTADNKAQSIWETMKWGSVLYPILMIGLALLIVFNTLIIYRSFNGTATDLQMKILMCLFFSWAILFAIRKADMTMTGKKSWLSMKKEQFIKYVIGKLEGDVKKHVVKALDVMSKCKKLTKKFSIVLNLLGLLISFVLYNISFDVSAIFAELLQWPLSYTVVMSIIFLVIEPVEIDFSLIDVDFKGELDSTTTSISASSGENSFTGSTDGDNAVAEANYGDKLVVKVDKDGSSITTKNND
ncbi:hypothetical protein [Moritella sp. F3]|uniref:hypothetical protein n=1 Tax=Moritella sp. F3 TaxID=2718882 RepID=UPI0018E13C5D|nr:hypothetical protein [Moritella sp. F3]GIC77613.1 hypothetical protein FMO001_23400 [Moritella sp. F1]GIC82026.1 hypothetical protein FMO003_23070 [Moritella sp. F3]